MKIISVGVSVETVTYSSSTKRKRSPEPTVNIPATAECRHAPEPTIKREGGPRAVARCPLLIIEYSAPSGENTRRTESSGVGRHNGREKSYGE